MILKDVKLKSKVTVEFYSNSDVIEVDMVIDDYEKRNDKLMLNPTYVDDRLSSVDFNSKNYYCKLYYSDGRITNVFDKVKLLPHRTLPNTYTCATNHSSKVLNKREAIRHMVNMICLYSRGNKPPTPAIIRDVSLTGFAIILQENIRVGETIDVSIQFPSGYCVSGNVRFKGNVKRVVEDITFVGDSTKIAKKEDSVFRLMGCSIENEPKDYRNWVMAIEREELKQLRGKL